MIVSLFFLVLILFRRTRNTVEYMTINDEALSNLASMYKNGKLKVSELEVTGNTTLNGHLHVKNGSKFEGGRHHFQDTEKSGWLRVGAAWNIPGIYAEDKKQVIVGSAKKIVFNGADVQINNNLNTNKNISSKQDINADRNIRAKGNVHSQTLNVNHDSSIMNLRIGNHFAVKKGKNEYKPVLYKHGTITLYHQDGGHRHGSHRWVHINRGKGLQVYKGGPAKFTLNP